jgi:serine/threonine-protein kinase
MVVETTATPSAPGSGAIDRDLQPGDVVGEYRVEGKLGQGGFGAVFKAVHPLIGKQVAIKVLSQRFSVDPEMLSRFVAEARAVNQIRHHNIIDIFSFGSLEDGRHYYVMEYLEGEPLDRRISRKGRLPLEEAIPILRAIARALDAAHGKGIAHRDLKAENVFLGRDADGAVFPKLLDFGIAKLLAPEHGLLHKTRTGAPMGTPHYMSPEQCHGRDVDHRTDLYAFGVLTYLMVTGTYPIDGDDYMTILMRQVSDEPPKPSSIRPELPPAVDDAVAWLMRKDPAGRPPSLIAAVRRLEGTASGGPGAMAELSAASSDRLATLPMGEGNTTPGGAALAGVARNRTPDGPPAAAAAESRLASTVPPAAGAAPAPAGLPTADGKRRPAPHLLLAGGALLAAAAIVAVMVVRSGRKGETPAAAPADAAAVAMAPDAGAVAAAAPLDAAMAPVSVDAAPALPADVFVTIEGTPPDTEVRRGGNIIGTAPGRVQIPRSDSEVLLVLSAEGFVPTTLVVIPSQNLTRTVKLASKGGRVRPVGPPVPPRGGSGSGGGARGSDEPTNDIEPFPPPKPSK